MYDRSGDGVGCYTRQKVQQNRPKSLQIFNRLFLSSLKAYSSLSYHHQLLPNNEWSNSRRWAFCLNLFVDWFVSITGKVTNVYETFGGVGLERRKKQPIRYWEWSRPILLDFLPCVTVRSKSFTIQVRANFPFKLPVHFNSISVLIIDGPGQGWRRYLLPESFLF